MFQAERAEAREQVECLGLVRSATELVRKPGETGRVPHDQRHF